MKAPIITKSSWKPKKYGHDYMDMRQLVVYHLMQGLATPEEVANEIHENDWLYKESDQRSYPKILKNTQDAWENAKKDILSIGNDKQDDVKLTEPDKIEKALEYVVSNIVYDTFKNQFLERDTRKEVGSSDCFIAYNKGIHKHRYIQKFFFDVAFESGHIPRYDPIQQWAETLPKWGPKNPDYIQQVVNCVPAIDPSTALLFIKTWLIKAYIQAINPHRRPYGSIVNRHFLILLSGENTGKSRFLEWLCPNGDWYSGTGVTPDRDGKVRLATYMFLVDEELSGLKFKEHEAFKALVSQSKVDIRLPYGKKDVSLMRHASFAGSTNSPEILPQGEKASRFLIIPLKDEKFNWPVYNNIDKNKLWSQIKYLAIKGKWLKDNEPSIDAIRNVINEEHKSESLESHLVDKYFRKQGQEYLKDGRVVVLSAGDVLTTLKRNDTLSNIPLNINKIGSALNGKFGERVNGFSAKNLDTGHELDKLIASDKRHKGYRIEYVPKGVVSETLDETLGGKKVVSRENVRKSKKKIVRKKSKK